MKAKMKGEQKMPESGDYECQRCGARFKVDGQSVICPQCGNTKLDELILFYVENDPEEEQMYTEADWHGGD